MRVPLHWLHDHVAPDLPVRELATRLAMTGTEVDRIHHHGVGAVERFVVGRVMSAEQHPDADRLRVCGVDVGETEPAQIVCGAPNVAAGQTVAVARPGAVMPDGTTLGRAKLRGVESDGMILAEDELAIGTDHAGILVLDEATAPAPGTPLAALFALADDVLDLEITPNRPDCLSVYGVAREVHAATGAPLAPAPWEGVELALTGLGPVVEVHDAERCPRLTAVLYEDVRVGPSPPWLKARLAAAGQRSISNVVDITNLAMLETGQPLHAWDADLIAGTLVVRPATAGEELVTLDGQRRAMPQGALIFADDEGPQSPAGIMGGDRSEVHAGTTRVLMEVATWDGPDVHATSTALGLRTEASARFEKGLSVEACAEGQAVAQRLMVELTGARVAGGLDVGTASEPGAVLRLREARVRSLLGVAIARERQRVVLEALGFGVAGADDGLEVTVPHWRRFDVTREADLIEEIARLEALDDLPATLPARRGASGRLTHAQRVRRRAEDTLAGRGLHEVAGWSFASPALLDALRLPADSPLRDVVRLSNPMSADESILRPTLLGSLLGAARHNTARGRERIALFESGTVYRAKADPGDRLADEHHALGVLLTGDAAPATWRSPAGAGADVFTAKALLAAVLDALRAPWELADAAWPFLHPGRGAEVRVAGERAGFLGELHPLVAGAWDLERVATFAVDLGKVAAAAPEVITYEDLTSFPPVRQDLAVVVAAGVAAGDVVAAVREGGGALLRSAEVFDRYDMGDERVSLALHLEFAAPDRTLTDDEVGALRDAIVALLANRHGATLRA